MGRVRLAVIGHVEWVTFARAPFVPAAGEIVHLEDPFSQPREAVRRPPSRSRRMGADVTFYTALGNDGRSRPVLEEHGVRVEAAMRDRPQTEVLALSDPAGERTLYVIGENDAPLAGDPLPWAEIAEMDGFPAQARPSCHRAPVLWLCAKGLNKATENVYPRLAELRKSQA